MNYFKENKLIFWLFWVLTLQVAGFFYVINSGRQVGESAFVLFIIAVCFPLICLVLTVVSTPALKILGKRLDVRVCSYFVVLIYGYWRVVVSSDLIYRHFSVDSAFLPNTKIAISLISGVLFPPYIFGVCVLKILGAEVIINGLILFYIAPLSVLMFLYMVGVKIGFALDWVKSYLKVALFLSVILMMSVSAIKIYKVRFQLIGYVARNVDFQSDFKCLDPWIEGVDKVIFLGSDQVLIETFNGYARGPCSIPEKTVIGAKTGKDLWDGAGMNY